MKRQQFVEPPNLCAVPGCTGIRWSLASPVFGWGLCRQHATDIATAVQLANGERKLPTRWVNRGTSGTIYYLLSDGLIKIGFARDLAKRLRAYPPSAEVLGTHPGTWDQEQALHAQFAAHCASGREWYQPADELLEHIATHASLPDRPGAAATRPPARPPQPVQMRARSRR